MPKVYTPTPEMARIARDVLELRATLAPSSRAGTPTGVARARDIANRRPMSAHTVYRMRSFFSRHGASPGSAEARQDRTTKAAQAWALWGGNPGRQWASAIVKNVERQSDDLRRQAKAATSEADAGRLEREADRLLREMRVG